MNKYLLTDIPTGSYFSKPVYLDPHFILAAPEMMFSEELTKTLTEWGFKGVFSEGEPQENYVSDDTTTVAASDSGEESTTSSSSPIPEGVGIASNDAEKIQAAEKFYTSFKKYVEQLFIQLTIKDELDFNSVAEKVKGVCEFVREDRRFLMRVLKNYEPPADENYLASHAVRSTIITIVIGTYLKLPAHKLIELGVAAVLHEVGMLQLPPQVYLSNRPLNPQEKKAILTHPVLSFNVLKSFDFPMSINLAALEHHERENGTGYPRKLTGEKISLFAKIIAVACSYEALSTKRPHKEAKDGYSGMLELLKNEGRQYDDAAVRALVFSLSIYPIGLYVLLSNGKRGQVIDVNPENPRFPIVQIFGELTPDGKNKTLQTSTDTVYITRPLSRTEIGSQA